MHARLVLQIQCKLFVFDKTSQSWVERGRGLLRLNDMASTDDGTLQSRLGELWPGSHGGPGGFGAPDVCPWPALNLGDPSHPAQRLPLPVLL